VLTVTLSLIATLISCNPHVNLAWVAAHLGRLPETLLYFTQAGTYALAFRAAHRGEHAPGHVYLASCLIHAVLGLLFCLPVGGS
jgi:hypothetical protein